MFIMLNVSVKYDIGHFGTPRLVSGYSMTYLAESKVAEYSDPDFRRGGCAGATEAPVIN